MIQRGGIEYLDAKHAAQYLGMARSWFYKQYLPYLKAHKLGRRKRKYYSLFDLDALRDNDEVIEPAA